MADAEQLLQAALESLKAEAPDLAADFADRAVRELRGPRPANRELPWSSTPTDPRYPEYVRRATRFLGTFAEHPRGELPGDQARMLARDVFPEEPRMVGPTFYRPGLLSSHRATGAEAVRITEKGRRAVYHLRETLDALA